MVTRPCMRQPGRASVRRSLSSVRLRWYIIQMPEFFSSSYLQANFYIKNRGGFAPLHLCCQNGHNETGRVLLLNGCKPDLKNNVSHKDRKFNLLYISEIYILILFSQYGDTPLHTSARYGHAGVIRILVSARCNASEQNKVRTSFYKTI